MQHALGVELEEFLYDSTAVTDSLILEKLASWQLY